MKLLGLEVSVVPVFGTEDRDREGALDELARDTTCERPEAPERFAVCRSCSGSGEAGDGPLSFCPVCRGEGRVAE